MSDFTPSSPKELYDAMLAWTDLRGRIAYEEKSQTMTWVIAEDLRLEISIFAGEGTVRVFDSAQPKILDLTHWHSEADILYQEMLDINKGKVKFAYIPALFGKQMVYVGFPSEKKKHRFRLIRYLGETSAQQEDQNRGSCKQPLCR